MTVYELIKELTAYSADEEVYIEFKKSDIDYECEFCNKTNTIKEEYFDRKIKSVWHNDWFDDKLFICVEE